ncbi:hypothetical protein S40288_00769 [Stachybotrys chartarum IBT 40288]|nr:hypothetical protein S40288_00769 [Stachybotrys chartarum IBT 40288]
MSSTARQVGSSKPERDHATAEPPSFESPIPCTDDRCLPRSTDGSRRVESAEQSLLNHLRIPLLLESILRITDEGDQLSRGLRLALGLRSVLEQHRLRTFAHSLSRTCDNFCEIGTSQSNQEVYIGYESNHEKLSSSDSRYQDDIVFGSIVEVGTATESPAALASGEPTQIAETEDNTPKEGCDEVPGSDTQPVADNDDAKQSTLQPKTGIGKGIGAMDLGELASMARTTLITSSPNVMPSIKPMTPERTPSPISLRGAALPRQTEDYQQDCLDLLDQAIDDFINDSHVQIRQFSTRGNSQETYKALSNLLRKNLTKAAEDRTRRLAKSPESALDMLIRELPGSPEKMTMLRLLEDQMTLLIEIYRMNPDRFNDDLESQGLPSLDLGLSTGYGELDGLYEQVRNSITGDMLVVKGTDFRLSVDSLRRLSGTRWLNDKVILACLHLSDKLAFVQVGFSILIH